MSQGHQAAYNFDGSGNFQLWSSAEAWQKGGENLFRHKDAFYFLPSMDEWYKAAYYDPNSGVYFNYSTGSDTAPTAVASGTASDSAVYSQTFVQGPADITLAGGLSSYGTMGQGGNVWELEETEFDLVNDSSSSARGIRGGSWASSSSVLLSADRDVFNPTVEFNDIGFRVASIPEPSTLLLGALTTVGILMRRRRLS